jgi:CHAD domain-containing protein
MIAFASENRQQYEHPCQSEFRTASSASAVSELEGKVFSDEADVEDLYKLRKEVKKLRYLMELASKPQPELEALARWQDALGEIHDIDIAVEQLKNVRDDGAEERAIKELLRARHSHYRRLVSHYTSRSRLEVARAGRLRELKSHS